MKTATILCCVLAVGGCSGPTPFEEVQFTVHDRTGRVIQWGRHSGEGVRSPNSPPHPEIQPIEGVDALLGKKLTAASAVQIALLNNHDLQATYEDLGVAEADLVQAGLLKNPVFSAAFEPAEGGAGIKIQLSVIEDFLDVLQVPLRKRIAEADLKAAEARVAGKVIGLGGKVEGAFYREEGELEILGLRRSVAKAADAGLELARRLHDAGNISDLEFYNRQAAREQAQIDLSEAEAAAGEGREDLNELMGIEPGQAEGVIEGRVVSLPEEEPAGQEVEKRALENNFEMAVIIQRTEKAAADLGWKEKVGALDDVELGAASEREFEGTWETGPAVGITIPIFDFGQARVAKARAEFYREVEMHRGLAARVRARVRRAEEEVAAARRRDEAVEGILRPLQEKIIGQTQLQYNGMLVGPFALLEARSRELELDMQAASARRDYWLARSELDQLVAGGDGGS